MKKVDLKVGMVVAVKGYGGNYSKATVVDLRAWEKPAYVSVHAVPKAVVLQDGTERVPGSARLSRGSSSSVLVEVQDRRFGRTEKVLEAVSLASILGEYEQYSAERTAEAERRREYAAKAQAAKAQAAKNAEVMAAHAKAALEAKGFEVRYHDVRVAGYGSYENQVVLSPAALAVLLG